MTPETLAITHAAAFEGQRGWDADEFRALLSGKGVILCGDAKSFILGRLVLDEAEVLTVATDPDFRRQGRASAALTAFCTAILAQGGTSVFLEVSADNKPAIHLYLKEKFEECGHRKNYYTSRSGTKSDALIMRRDLSASEQPA